MPLPVALRSLRHRNFQLFFGGQLISLVGTWMQTIALNSSMFNGARIVGPAVAGILVARIGEGWGFFANAVSYLAVIAGLAAMHVQARRHVPTGTPLETVLEGFRYVQDTVPIRAL